MSTQNTFLSKEIFLAETLKYTPQNLFIMTKFSKLNQINLPEVVWALHIKQNPAICTPSTKSKEWLVRALLELFTLAETD